MKFIILLIALATSTISLFAQDLNMTNDQEKNKAEKIKKDRKIEFGLSTSTSFLPSIPDYQNHYFVVSTDSYNIGWNQYLQVDSNFILSNTTDTIKNDYLSSRLLYNFGISLRFNLNKKLYLSISPFYSVYKPKNIFNGNSLILGIDDLSTVSNRPQFDRILLVEAENYLNIPISIGYKLNNRIEIEVGSQLTSTLSPLPLKTTYLNSTGNYESADLKKIVPISAFVDLDVNITNNLSANFKVNYGNAFYLPNRLKSTGSLIYYNGNVQHQYSIDVRPKPGTENAAVAKYLFSAGLKFRF